MLTSTVPTVRRDAPRPASPHPARLPGYTPAPRSVCPEHTNRVTRCRGCKAAAAAYAAWRRKQMAYGCLPRRIDPAAARAHLAQVIRIRELGLDEAAILCGISRPVLGRIISGKSLTIPEHVESTILAIPLQRPIEIIAPVEQVTYLTTIGVARRLRALQTIGYPDHDIAARLSASASTVTRWRQRRLHRIPLPQKVKVDALYEELHTLPGTCTFSARTARNHGYAPPICWDNDGDLDNFRARPRGHTAWLATNPPLLAGAYQPVHLPASRGPR